MVNDLGSLIREVAKWGVVGTGIGIILTNYLSYMFNYYVPDVKNHDSPKNGDGSLVDDILFKPGRDMALDVHRAYKK